MKPPETNQPAVWLDNEEPKQVVKWEWVESLKRLGAMGGTLREAANHAIAIGVAREELIEWGVEAGYSEGQMRNLVSKLLRQKGFRERTSGAGRKTAPEALELLSLATERHGQLAEKLLYAAARAAKAARKSAASQPGHTIPYNVRYKHLPTRDDFELRPTNEKNMRNPEVETIPLRREERTARTEGLELKLKLVGSLPEKIGFTNGAIVVCDKDKGSGFPPVVSAAFASEAVIAGQEVSRESTRLAVPYRAAAGISPADWAEPLESIHCVGHSSPSLIEARFSLKQERPHSQVNYNTTLSTNKTLTFVRG